MTPTLLGRWQTRLLLSFAVGSLVTLPFFFGWIGPGGDVFFRVLLCVALLGVLLWDPLYNYLQSFRWDHDWPALYQLLAGIWEGFFFYVPFKLLVRDVLQTKLLGERDLPLEWFTLHYVLVWLATFAIAQTFMRVIFPRWRFRGGQWL